MGGMGNFTGGEFFIMWWESDGELILNIRTFYKSKKNLLILNTD